MSEAREGALYVFEVLSVSETISIGIRKLPWRVIVSFHATELQLLDRIEELSYLSGVPVPVGGMLFPRLPTRGEFRLEPEELDHLHLIFKLAKSANTQFLLQIAKAFTVKVGPDIARYILCFAANF